MNPFNQKLTEHSSIKSLSSQKKVAFSYTYLIRFFITILFLLLLIGCDFNTFRKNKIEDKQEAEKVTEKFYSLVKDNNKPEIIKLFSDKFLKATSSKDLNQLLDWAITEGKNSSSHSLSAWQTLVVKGTNSKSEYSFTYNVQRGKISTQEIFTLEKEDNKIKIVTYQINLNIPK